MSGTAQARATAAAAPPPLRGLPLLYDSNNKLIGPYDGYVLVYLKGNYVYLPADSTGFRGRYPATFFYTKHNCVGKRYLPINTGGSDLLQNGIVSEATIYLPGIDQGTQQVLSQYGPNYSKPGQPIECQDFGTNPQSLSLTLPTTIGVSSLGFTPPFHLQAP